jgi:MFS superfamily sulfate permease-like transporter
MKALVTAIMLAFASFAVQAAEPAKKDAPKAEVKKEDNCVKKDKDGKCPPVPKGDKPTPKKKVEAK